MEPLSLEQIANGCGGVLMRGAGGGVVERVCTDSRGIRRGDLFAAIRGERFDGHQFVSQAIRDGAVAAMVDQDFEAGSPAPFPLIQVEGTRPALGRLAGWWRDRLNPVCVAIAGSNGKTSTKDMLGSVLRKAGDSIVSPASFNNDLGVPLTLLQLGRQSKYAALEVGSNHPGELRPLLNLIRPAHGILTGIGPEHLEFFKDLDGVFEEESSLAEFISEDGFLLVPSDIHRLDDLRELTRGRVITVGVDSSADWAASDLKLSWEGATFEVVGPDPDCGGPYRIPLLGRHQVVNALLVIGISSVLGIPAGQIRAGLSGCPRPGMRLEPVTVGGVRILNDAYNANLDSMKAALALLSELPVEGRRIAFLGDMGELGHESSSSHRELGVTVAASKLDVLVGVGERMFETVAVAGDLGTPRTVWVKSVAEAGSLMAELVRDGDSILLKASRFMRLETVLEQYRSLTGGDGHPGRQA